MKKIILLSLCVCISSISTISQADIKQVTAKDLDMNHVKNVKDKKRRFFDFMRPIINDENAKVRKLQR